eukprot:TRINITY_DN13394_c0_g1_i1.p1 TRINITY_DN13394_c0_g1~~TRINITY_DN13394_c0_g1_i1.p1  ORF type:complete len:85 (+),score=3.65 TRINITY_DN13394_c0_g1_i1:173-427(+)
MIGFVNGDSPILCSDVTCKELNDSDSTLINWPPATQTCARIVKDCPKEDDSNVIYAEAESFLPGVKCKTLYGARTTNDINGFWM